MKLGLVTLGDLTPHPHDKSVRAQAQRYQDIITLGRWAEELGFDSFHVGEHHFSQYIVSNPLPLLAAIAAHTVRIRLSTAVTLLANRDPVLVAEDYAALDLISDGRVELVVGRGNLFAECYRQMGQDLAQSRVLFEENLDLLLRIWGGGPISSSGLTRPALNQARIEPQPLQKPFPLIWIGGGSTPDSAMSAAKRGLAFQAPGVFAGAPFFRDSMDLYRAHFTPGKWGLAARQVGFTAHCFVGADTERARAYWAPYYLGYLNWVTDVAAGGHGKRTLQPSFEKTC
jgi:alkanesulfonate monooxygenase SsuD/methylene tetrahydromethanopterin reductase-like flavin-dependent oxidoreductase (luciferase family)